MATNKNKRIVFEGCQLVYRNFEGRETQYNRKGDQNFSVIIDDLKLAEQLKSDGWNVKYPKPSEDGVERFPTLPVSLRFDNYPPNIVLLTSRGRTNLDQETSKMLDWASFENVDLIVNGFEWEPGRIKAYVKSLFVKIEEDELDLKYAEVPLAGSPTGGITPVYDDDEPPF